MKRSRSRRDGTNMEMTFEWDEDKDFANRKKHGVSFEEAKSVFGDPSSITIADEAHSGEEDRYIDVGVTARGRVVVVAYTERGENIRIISCRLATKAERRVYEKGQG